MPRLLPYLAIRYFTSQPAKREREIQATDCIGCLIGPWATSEKGKRGGGRREGGKKTKKKEIERDRDPGLISIYLRSGKGGKEKRGHRGRVELKKIRRLGGWYGTTEALQERRMTWPCGECERERWCAPHSVA